MKRRHTYAAVLAAAGMLTALGSAVALADSSTAPPTFTTTASPPAPAL